MRRPAIHQFAAGFTRGDAISSICLELQKIFRSWGCSSSIFAEASCIMPALRDQVGTVEAFTPSADGSDIVLLHLSIGSPVNLRFQQLPCRKAILYHNVTPASYMQFINARTAAHLEHGREQVKALAGCAGLNLADSRFNADELDQLGYHDVRVFPLPFNFAALESSVDHRFLKQMDDGLTTILFVGRCAPNKRIEHLLNLFATYQHTVNPDSRLIHVGAWQGTERYHALLTAQARELQLEHVLFTGMIPQEQLNACYRRADVFVCMSEHEGFCMPLIEAMVHHLPVMAFASSAIPETLDGSGVLLHRHDYPLAAELLHRLVHDQALRRAVLAGQDRRLERYRNREPAAELRRHFEPYLEGAA